MKSLEYYINCFAGMNCNKQRGKVAPHKAMMLIAVMNEVANGHITNGFVPHSERMVLAFERAWNQYVGRSAVFNLAFNTPFYHLGNEPFWHLMKTDAYVESREYSLKRLRESFYGAKIDDKLFAFMENALSRQTLKRALLEKFLPGRLDNMGKTMVAEIPGTYGTTTLDIDVVDRLAA